VIDYSLQAVFLRTRGSKRSRISLFPLVIRSQTVISLFVRAHISDSFSHSICFSGEPNVGIICTLKFQYRQESAFGNLKKQFRQVVPSFLIPRNRIAVFPTFSPHPNTSLPLEFCEGRTVTSGNNYNNILTPPTPPQLAYPDQ
jgi:hypothetical protein